MSSKVIQLPIDGAGIGKLKGITPDALADQGTTRLFLGQSIEIQHASTGTYLTYVLRDASADAGSPPAGVTFAAGNGWVYAIFPSDYNASTNDVFWSLESITKYGNPVLWNPDVNTGGSPSGGFVTQSASGTPAQLSLSAEIINAVDFI